MQQEFVTTQRFEDHIKECDEKSSSLSTSIKEIRVGLENRVTHKDFQWALSGYMSIILLVLGWIVTMNYQFRIEFRESNKDIITKVERINEKQSETGIVVGKIQEKIAPLDFELKK